MANFSNFLFPFRAREITIRRPAIGSPEAAHAEIPRPPLRSELLASRFRVILELYTYTYSRCEKEEHDFPQFHHSRRCFAKKFTVIDFQYSGRIPRIAAARLIRTRTSFLGERSILFAKHGSKVLLRITWRRLDTLG